MITLLHTLWVWQLNGFYDVLYFVESVWLFVIALGGAGYLYWTEWRETLEDRPPTRRQL